MYNLFNKLIKRWNSRAGFSLIEMCIVLMAACVIGGFAVISATGMKPGIDANRARYAVVQQLRNGREQAMAQRRDVQVIFQNGDEIQLVRHNLPTGSPDTILSAITLGHKCEFRLFTGIPDTPDAFGNATEVSFGSATTMTFSSDGTLVDQSGNPVNGTVFFGLENHPESARAVTILGATGRVRSYRWNGASWIQ
jgi:Tfp pilus assembly protein FimT